MTALQELLERGGPVMIALIIVSVLLYERCFSVLIFLFRAQRQVSDAIHGPRELARVRALQHDLPEAFRQQRLAVDAMITAAPLLGLLGTVMGMTAAFDNLSALGGQRSMDGLARGISEVLIATETGLAVAIPAVLVVYYAHRQLQKGMQRLAVLESTLLESS